MKANYLQYCAIFAIHSHASAFMGVHESFYSLLMLFEGLSAIPAFWFFQTKTKKQCCHELHCIWVSVCISDELWSTFNCSDVAQLFSKVVVPFSVPASSSSSTASSLRILWHFPFLGHCVGGGKICSLLEVVSSCFLVGLNFINLQRTVSPLILFQLYFSSVCFIAFCSFLLSFYFFGLDLHPDLPIRDSWY